MSNVKISAPVGLDPRESEGKPVKNKPSDVLLVRQMLEANGIGPLGTSNSADAGLLKAIEKYQKKIGIKKPDRVIDPGERTFKAAVTKLEKQMKDAAKEPIIKVNFRGKDIECTQKQYDALVKEVLGNLLPYMKSLVKMHCGLRYRLAKHKKTDLVAIGITGIGPVKPIRDALARRAVVRCRPVQARGRASCRRPPSSRR